MLASASNLQTILLQVFSYFSTESSYGSSMRPCQEGREEEKGGETMEGWGGACVACHPLVAFSQPSPVACGNFFLHIIVVSKTGIMGNVTQEDKIMCIWWDPKFLFACLKATLKGWLWQRLNWDNDIF